jgi:hypothetical protein
MKPATYTVTLRTLPGSDGIRGLRALLKAALRRHRLRAIDIRECPHNSARPPRRVGSDWAAGVGTMSLGKRKGSDFMPVFKYDAKAGSFYKQDRVLTQDGWGNEQTDVGNELRAGRVIFDFDTTKIGWLYFPKGPRRTRSCFHLGKTSERRRARTTSRDSASP